MNRTRIAIPLHRSGRWVENVAANLHRLAGHAAITVSDATGEDDAFELLRAEFGSAAGVEWLGPRPIAPGWVGHCNELLARSTEPYFAWLPHDDEIGSDWVDDAENVLDSTPWAVLALGTLVPVDEPGVTNGGHRIEPFAPFSDRDDRARVRRAAEICAFGDHSLLGAAFRGVMRRDRAVPLPASHEGDEWADVLWAVRMLVRGPFAAMPAVYGKRWHPQNTHSSWGDVRRLEEFRTRLLPSALLDLDAAEREVVLTSAWTAEVAARSAEASTLRAEVAARSAEASALREEAAAHARVAAELREEFESSRSWRVTGPLRKLSTRWKALTRRRERRGQDEGW